MKRFIKWLERKFSQRSAADEADEPHTTIRVRAKPKDIAKEEYSVEVAFDASVPGRDESDESGKDVLMPDIYGFDDTIPQRHLRILDESSPDDSESTEFDPYNSGSFDTSKT